MAAIGTGLWCWHWHFAFRQFGGMDGSVLVNGAWQQYVGGVAYRDFLTGVPPFHLLLGGLAFKLLGPTWSALTALAAVFSVLSFGAAVLLGSWCGLTFLEATFLSLALQATTTCLASWWWYNQVTSVIAALCLLSCGAVLKNPDSVWRWCAHAAACAFLVLCKLNVAAPVFAGTLFVLLTCRWRRALGFTTAALAAVVAGLFSIGVDPIDILHEYLRTSHRVLNTDNLLHFAVLNDPWEAVPAILLAIIINGAGLLVCSQVASPPGGKLRAWGTSLGVLLLGALTSTIGFLTNNDYNVGELPPLLVGSWVLAATIRSSWIHDAFVRYHMRCLTGILVALTCCGLLIGFHRLRVVSTGEGRFASYGAPLTRVEDGVFQGMFAIKRFHTTRQELKEFLAGAGGAKAVDGRVFIGPRIDFAYADLRLRSPRGLPLWWESVADDSPMVRRFLSIRFEYLVFLDIGDGTPDVTFLPGALQDDIRIHYRRIHAGAIVVFRRTDQKNG